MEQTLSRTVRMIRELTSLGVSLVVVGLVVDILFPGSTGIVANVGVLVGGISDNGLAGLIALLLFVAIYRGGGQASSAQG